MRVIYVDDEQPALETFRMKVKDFPEIESLHLFSSGEDALRFQRITELILLFWISRCREWTGLTLREN